MMKNLYLDESGECSFAQSSIYKHFLIAVLSIDTTENKKIKNYLRRIFARFIRNGWDKTKEIKASSLFKNKKFGAKAVSRSYPVTYRDQISRNQLSCCK